MLQKWFARYARAVHDAGERKALYRLYCAKVVAAAVFFALCAAILIEAFIFSDSFETAEIDAPFIVFGLTLLLWFAAAATAFVLWLVFRLTYRRILTRPPQAGEMPEVASYREKTRADRKSDAKALRIPVAVLVLGLLVLLVTLVIDSVNNPDSAEPGLAAMIGIGIFAVCLCVFLLALIFIQYKKSAAGANIEAQTADEAEAIDAAQGRRHKYSLAADKNAASFRYLFPDEALRAQVEAVSAKQQTAVRRAIIVSCVVGLAAAFVFCSPYVFGRSIVGFAFPVFMAILTVGVAAASIPYARRLNALDKAQKAGLESDPAYAKNLFIYRKYEAFSRRQGRILPGSLLVSLLVSFVLAALFPQQPWSLLSVVLLIAGLLLNGRFVSALRKAVIPVEAEIDRERETAAAALQAGSAAVAAAGPDGGSVADDGTTLPQ